MKRTKFKPMKAAESDDMDLSELKFPLYGTPKIDGIRCVIQRGRALTSSLSPIPNKYIRKMLKNLPPFDGELAVGANFQNCTSGIMSHDGEPDFKYYVFDQIPIMLDTPYLIRAKFLHTWQVEKQGKYADKKDNYAKNGFKFIQFLHPVKLDDLDELLLYLRMCLRKGYEGIIVRSGSSPYKHGRSTWREGYCIKFKAFKDAEAKIVGVFEQMQNNNEKKKDKLGHSKRSSHLENFTGKNTLGGFICSSPKWSKTFRVGTGQGLDTALRKKIWSNPKKYIGKQIKFKYQEMGTKDRPRIPVMLGFRDRRDK